MLAGLLEGPFEISVRAPGYAPQTRPHVEPGTSGVTIVLESGGTISGEVVDQDGRPVENYRVMARPMERRAK